MLRLERVSSQYEGKVVVLRDISLKVEKGEITCLLGSNGAGKTTLMRTIVNIVRPLQGHIYFEDRRIDQLKTHQIIKRGISVVPEGRRIFPQFSVRDNLRVGAFLENDIQLIHKKMDGVFEVFPVLKERISQFGETLSGGEQGMLAIARALMSGPKILLLDEPSLGLAPLLVREFFKVIKRINEKGMTILLIEQNARKALSIASKGYVLQKGEIVAEGTREELRNSEILRSAYLRG
ncbi:MAG: ABC transporter ATP-binding protein [Thermodesulfobacteriota bacterium]|jgi:branched-chain amino acid transport system ATP-binding protein